MVRVLCLLACLLTWRSAAARAEPSSREERFLERVERDVADGKSPRAIRRLGQALRKGEFTDSRVWLRYAELRTPCSPDTLLRLSAAELSKAKLVWSAFPEPLAGTAADSDVTHRRLLLHRAVFLGSIDQAQSGFAVARGAARRGDRESTECLRQLAAQAVAHEQLDLATVTLEFARSLMPEDHALPRELGMVLLAQGNAQAAVVELEAALTSELQDLDVRRDLAYALASAGRAQEGYALLAADSARCTEEARCRLELARLAFEAATLELAAEHASALVKEHPKDLAGWLLLGEIMSHRRMGDEAKQAYEEALRIAPGNARAREALKALSGVGEEAR